MNVEEAHHPLKITAGCYARIELPNLTECMSSDVEAWVWRQLAKPLWLRAKIDPSRMLGLSVFHDGWMAAYAMTEVARLKHQQSGG